MSDRPRPHRVVALPATAMPAGMAIPPGVLPAPCAVCGVPVLLSPSSRALIAAGGAQPCCPACAAAETAGRPVLPLLAPGGDRELRQYRRDHAARN